MGRMFFLLFLVICTLLSVLDRGAANAASAPATLTIQIVEPLRDHEGPPGKSRIQLFRDKKEKPFFDKALDGIWVNLGYRKRENAYLLGGLFAEGGFLPVRKLFSLSIDSLEMTFPGGEAGWWSALAGLLSPDGEYWAFVGHGGNDHGEEIAPFGLFAIWLERNKTLRIGDAPPPVPENPPPGFDDIDNEFYWVWGGHCCDGYFRPDRRVMRFAAPHLLSVDYGYDPVKKHLQKKIVDFDLPKIFSKGKINSKTVSYGDR